jgi:hypothetical protein
MTLTICVVFLVGLALGLRFNFLTLYPAILFAMMGAAASGDGIGATVLMMLWVQQPSRWAISWGSPCPLRLLLWVCQGALVLWKGKRRSGHFTPSSRAAEGDPRQECDRQAVAKRVATRSWR